MRIVVAIGTRPDVIKMVPLIKSLRELGEEVNVWWSGQGKDIQDGAVFPVDAVSGGVEWLNMGYGISKTIARFYHYLTPGQQFSYDYDWDEWENGHTIREQTVDETDLVVVHGDDATAYACAVAAFLHQVPVAHVEAGLRTYESTPFPEEAFRKMIGCVATLHFCPDQVAYANLCYEKFSGKAWVVGNTVNDTLPDVKPKILVTLHRRENWGERIQNALNALGEISEEAEITVVEHPNWQNRYEKPEGIHYTPPLGREEFIDELLKSHVVFTDSGGLQEECAFLSIPCLVYRTSTERVALVNNGAVELVHPEQVGEPQRSLRRVIERKLTYGHDVSRKIAHILAREGKLGEK